MISLHPAHGVQTNIWRQVLIGGISFAQGQGVVQLRYLELEFNAGAIHAI